MMCVNFALWYFYFAQPFEYLSISYHVLTVQSFHCRVVSHYMNIPRFSIPCHLLILMDIRIVSWFSQKSHLISTDKPLSAYIFVILCQANISSIKIKVNLKLHLSYVVMHAHGPSKFDLYHISIQYLYKKKSYIL